MNKWIFIALLLFAVSCNKETSSSSTDLSDYKVFNEELKTMPVCEDGFVFVSSKDSGLLLEKVSTDGVKKTISTITAPVDIDNLANFSLLSSETNKYWVLFTYSGTYNSVTTEIGQITQITVSKSDTVKKEITFPISTDTQNQYTFCKAFLTENGGFMTVSTFSDRQKLAVEFIYYDSQGNIINTYRNTNIKDIGTVTNMTRLSNGNIIAFPISYTEGLTLQAQKLIFFNKEATKLNIDSTSLGITQIHSLITSNDTTVVIGSSFTNYSNTPTQIIVIDPSGKKLWEQNLGVACFVYSVTKFNSGYILTGTGNEKIRTDYDFNSLSDGSNVSWLSIDLTGGSVKVNTPLTGEYLSTGVASIVTDKNELCILGTKKSFELYNNVIFLKTALK